MFNGDPMWKKIYKAEKGLNDFIIQQWCHSEIICSILDESLMFRVSRNDVMCGSFLNVNEAHDKYCILFSRVVLKP